MGYITTISIHNDGADQLEKHPEELAKKLSKACSGIQLNCGYNYDSVGNHCNLLTLQKPRHADDTTLYLHWGNTVVDADNAKSERVIDAFISEMKYQTKRLKELKNQIKDKQNERKQIVH